MSSDASGLVLNEVHAEMGRQRLTGRALAARMEVPRHWVHRRLNGDVTLTVDDLTRIAAALGREPRDFLPHAEPAAS